MKNIVIGLVCLMIGGCSSLESAKIVQSMGYVNMGSSFAAGSGISPAKPQSPERCRQSVANYATLLANSLKLKLDDQSCAGAKSIHLLQPWSELPAQVDAVDLTTGLVTITVGGNDLNYVRNLFAAACVEEKGLIIGDKKIPCPKEETVSEDEFLQLTENLFEIRKQISLRSPKAKVVFIQYVTLLPDELCELTPLTEEEAIRARKLSHRLAAITSDVADQTNSMMLSIDELSIGHTACNPEPWSLGATKIPNDLEGMPWHPNRLANEVIANQLKALLQE